MSLERSPASRVKAKSPAYSGRRPNGKNQAGDIIPIGLLQPGLFNSPYGMAVDRQGNLFVAEWLIGGRFVKLENLRPQG